MTADPAEGEAFTESANNLVEPVAMPDALAEVVEALSPSTTSSTNSSNANAIAPTRKRWRGGFEPE